MNIEDMIEQDKARINIAESVTLTHDDYLLILNKLSECIDLINSWKDAINYTASIRGIKGNEKGIANLMIKTLKFKLDNL